MAADPALTLPPSPPNNLTATVLSLLSDVLRSRSGARLDNVAELQRLVAQLSDELARHVRDEADELWTVAEAVSKVGGTAVNMRKWINKHGIGHKDRRGCYLVSKAKLRDFLLRKYGGILPQHIARCFA